MTDPGHPSRPTESEQGFERIFRYYARLGRVHEHLLRHVSEPLSAEEAAKIAGLSPNYFSTYFRRCVGVSFTNWAHRVRIALAVERLRASDAGIAEVAYEVGYRDLRTFERAFKRHTSMTPRSFQQRVKPRVQGPAPRPGRFLNES